MAGDPVATTFQAPAGQNIDNASADALNNVAQSGAKGAAAMAATAQANASAKTQALQNAIAYTALRGGPAGNMAANQATIAQPFDQRASILGLMGTNYADNTKGAEQANANYMSGMKAGLPIAQTALDRTISNNQSANAAKRDTQNFELSLKQAEAQSSIDAHNAARDAANARLNAANKPLTPAQIIAALGGPDATADNLTGTAGRNLSTEESQAQANANNGGGTGPSGQGLGIYDQLADSPDAVGAALGLPSGTVQSLIDNATSKDTTQNKTTPPSDTAIRASDQYSSGLTKLDQLMQNATTPAARQAAVTALINDVGADVARVILNDYSTQNKIVTG